MNQNKAFEIDRFRPFLVLTLMSITTLFACGGGGDSGITGGGGGGGTNLAGDFSPSNPEPGANTVAMLGTANSNIVTLTVSVTGVTDLYGASFDVTYDPTMAEFANWSVGNILEDNNQQVTYQVNAQQAGRVIVGVSRVASGSGTNVGLTRSLVKLNFRVTETGTSSIGFDNPALLSGQDPPQSIGGIVFDGGTLIAN